MSGSTAVKSPDDSPVLQRRNARYGLWLFAVYLAFYGGFMALNVLSPETMKGAALFGLNVAIVYGMFLIVAALGLALVYTRLCRRPLPEGETER
ncbi:MAG: DUF485 domain-containing protein [Myxococcales bacterium]|nr:DUF485 domain-containing protein [Myxococcales bacterium]